MVQGDMAKKLKHNLMFAFMFKITMVNTKPGQWHQLQGLSLSNLPNTRLVLAFETDWPGIFSH